MFWESPIALGRGDFEINLKVPDLEIGNKTVKLRGTKVEAISSAKISTGLHKVVEARRAKMAENGEEEASPPTRSSPTAPSLSESYMNES